MAQSESAVLSDGAQMGSLTEEQVKSLIKAQFEEQVKSLIKAQFEELIIPLIKSQNGEVDHAKPEANPSKADVEVNTKAGIEGKTSKGLLRLAQFATVILGFSAIVSAVWFVGDSIGGLTSDVAGLRELNVVVEEKNQVRYEALEEKNQVRYEALEEKNQVRYEALEEKNQVRYEAINKRFDDVNTRFDDVNRRFDDVDKRFDDINDRLKRIEDLLMNPPQR